ADGRQDEADPAGRACEVDRHAQGRHVRALLHRARPRGGRDEAEHHRRVEATAGTGRYPVRPLGGVAERSNAAVSKTVSGSWVRRGFKSLPLRSLLLVVVVALVAPPAASAHVRSGVVAVDYRADVSSTPSGVAARIYESDLAVRLTAGTARSVAVLGYLGEPFIRITGAGVAVNDASPTGRHGALGRRARLPRRAVHSHHRCRRGGERCLAHREGRPARQTRTLGCVARRTRERVTAGRRAQALDDPARR